MRVLIETGICLSADSAPVFAAAIISFAKVGFFIKAAHAPCFSIFRSGHPIFISTPSKPISSAKRAAFSIRSGFDVKN